LLKEMAPTGWEPLFSVYFQELFLCGRRLVLMFPGFADISES
jgi:hypothetical protein